MHGLLACGWLASAAASDEIAVDSMQYRLDRLYFPVGEESRVFRYSSFGIYRADTVIYSGYVEHSWTGISASEQTAGFFDTIDVATLEAVILTAAVDCSANLSVAYDFLPRPGQDLSSDTWVPSDSDHCTIYKSTGDTATMWDDFRNGDLDAVVSFRRLIDDPSRYNTRAFTLPFLVMLVPDIGKPCNFHGQFTTSLYYRFDPIKLDLMFDGDARVPSSPSDTEFNRPWSVRSFEYNPENGRALLQVMEDRPSTVSIHYSLPFLRKAALYFADVLAQDRIEVTVSESTEPADLQIQLIRVKSTRPASHAFALQQILARDTVVGSPPAEYLAQIRSHLDYLWTATSETDYYETIARIERKFTDDLGVFALFYPVCYLHTQRYVEGVIIDEDGNVDFSRACLLRLPRPPEREDTP